MMYVVFNAFVAAQQYSISFDKQFTYAYPVSLDMTDTVRLLSTVFLILHVMIMLRPIRRSN